MTRTIDLEDLVNAHFADDDNVLPQVWKHFITETDDRRWTEGKRKAEKDALVGISFLTTIQVLLYECL